MNIGYSYVKYMNIGYSCVKYRYIEYSYYMHKFCYKIMLFPESDQKP